jgi:hypothetical protein
MACFRLTFHNRQVFEVEVTAARVDAAAVSVYAAIIYRVTGNAREARPLQGSDGQPITIHAVTERAAVDIAIEVLRTVSGSPLERVGKCGGFPPPLLSPA